MRFSVAVHLPATLLTAAVLAAPAVAEPPITAPAEPSVLPSAPPADAPPAPDLASPTVLVQAASEAVAQEVADRHGLTLDRAFPWIGWYELATPPGTTDASAAKAALDADADVKATDAVAREEQVALAITPQDPVWSAAPLASGESQTWNLVRANFPSAWNQATGGGRLIGIIDSEFDLQHPDLKTKMTGAWNLASGTLHYQSGDVRADGDSPLHGTHVAGIAGAFTNNNVGISGAGFNAAIVPVRINTYASGGGNPVDARFVGDLIQALGYMIGKNPDVVNISLGTTFPHAPLQTALNQVRARGITVVAAAGNNQEVAPNDPVYPAAYDGVIAVANTQSDDSLSMDSSNGAWVDVAAPGTHIVSTWDGGGYEIASGTSMAAPLVSGLVALMKSVRPDLTPDEVESLLKGTAHDLGIPGRDSAFGYGLIDASAAVSAAAAYVRPTPPPPPTPSVAPSPPPAPPADTVAPKVTVAGLVTVAGRSVAVRIKCSEGCNGAVRLRSSKRRLLASKSFGAGAGKTVTVRLKTRKRLKPRSKVLVEVSAKDASGNLATKVERRKLRR
jgi:hypothetical protein